MNHLKRYFILFIISFYSRYGGIIPKIAGDMHRQNITGVCETALRAANLRLKDVDAIATTIKPGLHLSLAVGNAFGQYLSRVGEKPYIPIDHMEAHALTVRMVEAVSFNQLHIVHVCYMQRSNCSYIVCYR